VMRRRDPLCCVNGFLFDVIPSPSHLFDLFNAMRRGDPPYDVCLTLFDMRRGETLSVMSMGFIQCDDRGNPSVMYRYFPCLPASSALSYDLPDLSRPSQTPFNPFPVFHPLPNIFHCVLMTSTASTGFHWLPPASAHFRSEPRSNSPCLGVMTRNSHGPFRPKRHLIVPLCLGTLFLVIIVFIVLSLSHCSSLLLFVYYYI